MTSPPSAFSSAHDTDFILRSSEPLKDFHLHRSILSLASPFFSHMLQLPQPPCWETGPPIVDVPESPCTLESLLRLIYPMPDPVFDSIDELALVLHAAVKYDMRSAVESLRKQLAAEKFVATCPTRVYAIASRYDLEEEAKIASRYTLSINMVDVPLFEDLKHITAFSYHRLLSLHQTRARDAQKILQIHEEVKCMECNGVYGAFSAGPKWWLDFEKRAKEELRLRPTSDLIFSVGFIAKSINGVGCRKCPESILNSWKFLDELKRKIDELPATV